MNALWLLAMAGYCAQPNLVSTAMFSSRDTLYVYDSVEPVAALTTTTIKADGTFGVNVPLSVAQRSIRNAANILNNVSSDIPKVVYAGTYSGQSIPGNSVIIGSPNPADFNYFCSSQAAACVVPSQTSYGRIHFKGSSNTTDWTTSGGQPNTDLVATMVHELVHLLGLGHTSSTCGGGGISDGAVLPRGTMNVGSNWLPLSNRFLYRDDIEGLRAIWGAKSAALTNHSGSIDPLVSWSGDTDVPAAGLGLPVAVTSSYAKGVDLIVRRIST